MSLKQLRESLARARARAHHHTLRARANRRLAKRRVKQIRRLEHDGQGALAWALRQVGTVEHPAGSNQGPKIDDWNRASGLAPGPAAYWCQTFANAAARAAGAPQLRSAYTPAVLRGMGGYRPIPVSQARAGDFIYFKFPGVSRDPCDHVGVLDELRPGTVVCVEGNTSPPAGAGSQNNGGGVYVRERPRSLVVGAVRPPYPNGA